MSEKPKRKNKPGAGPPYKDVDKELIRKLAVAGCNAQTIANCVGVHVRTIERNYAGLIKKARAEISERVLVKLVSKAVDDGDTTCLIWLSKQYLGFREPKYEIDQTAKGSFNITMVDYAAASTPPSS
jgi:hypothetical protein